ncbi:hypothetical protein CCP3SC5AM1_1390002 [Gammaproteobacteria bacterium]
MPELVQLQTPITNEIYCFTAPFQDKYFTLIISPLLPYLIAPTPLILKMAVGERVFIGKTDKPIYLIPFDSTIASQLANSVVQFDLYPSGTVPNGMNRTALIPLEFRKEVAQHFSYKIEEGRLYKHEEMQWNLVLL